MLQRENRFGNYLLEERIAVGGMAEVFRARRLGAAGFARQVCIKRILPALCANQAFIEMFVDEARTGAKLRQSNIVAIDDFGEVNGQYFLCMELVSGVDLARLIRQLAQSSKGCPAEVAALIAAEILKALDYAHRKVDEAGKPLGIVHRDVSPHNVIVSFSGEIKLTDFGIAKASSRLHQTVNGVVKGKLAYMAPERIRNHELDGRADLFALGVVLFEAFAGCRPFTGPTETAVVAAILRGERPRLRTLRPDVSPALESVVDRLLETDIEQRYGSASEALIDLAAVQPSIHGPRLLAAILAHYFPGRSTAQYHHDWFSPDLLPSVAAAGTAMPSTQSQPLEATDALTEVSNMLEATLHAETPVLHTRETSPTDPTRTMADPAEATVVPSATLPDVSLNLTSDTDSRGLQTRSMRRSAWINGTTMLLLAGAAAAFFFHKSHKQPAATAKIPNVRIHSASPDAVSLDAAARF